LTAKQACLSLVKEAPYELTPGKQLAPLRTERGSPTKKFSSRHPTRSDLSPCGTAEPPKYPSPPLPRFVHPKRGHRNFSFFSLPRVDHTIPQRPQNSSVPPIPEEDFLLCQVPLPPPPPPPPPTRFRYRPLAFLRPLDFPDSLFSARCFMASVAPPTAA